MKPNISEQVGTAELRRVPVRFEFTHPTATAVAVVGSFNNWHHTNKSMQRAKRGHWVKEAFLLPGTYEYRLIVDGQWMADPLVKETVPNPFGGQNSILTVLSDEATHLVEAENLPLKNANKPEKHKNEQTNPAHK